MAVSNEPGQALFLNIETKKDSAAKVAAVVGKPHNEIVWAKEINATTKAVNQLRGMIALTGAQITQIMGESKIDLGAIDTDPVTHINNLAEPIELGIETQYIVFTYLGVSYVYGFVGEPFADYGLGHHQVLGEQLLKLWSSDTVPVVNPMPYVSALLSVSCYEEELGGLSIFPVHNGLTPHGFTYGIYREATGSYKLWVNGDQTKLSNVFFFWTPLVDFIGGQGGVGGYQGWDNLNRKVMALFGRSGSGSLAENVITQFLIEVRFYNNPEGQ